MFSRTISAHESAQQEKSKHDITRQNGKLNDNTDSKMVACVHQKSQKVLYSRLMGRLQWDYTVLHRQYNRQFVNIPYSLFACSRLKKHFLEKAHIQAALNQTKIIFFKAYSYLCWHRLCIVQGRGVQDKANLFRNILLTKTG